MMASLWVKVYYEILDDFKYHNIPDDSKLLMYELFLLTRKMHAMNNGGQLPGKEEIAFQLRRSPEFIESAMMPLLRLNIVSTNGEGYIITKFTDRQKADDPKERIRVFRNKPENVTNIQLTCNETVTNRYTDIDRDIEVEIDKEKSKEGESEALTAVADTHPNWLIQSIKNSIGRFPPKNTWVTLTEQFSTALPEDNYIDEILLSVVYDSWCAHGYNRTNYSGILDWYISKSFNKQDAQRSKLTEVSV
jgi:hypothetical protein